MVTIKQFIKPLLFLNIWWCFPYPFYENSVFEPVYLGISAIIGFIITLSLTKASINDILLIIIILFTFLLSLYEQTIRSTTFTLIFLFTLIAFKYLRHMIVEYISSVTLLVTTIQLAILCLSIVGVLEIEWYRGGLLGYRTGGIYREPSHVGFSLYLLNMISLTFLKISKGAKIGHSASIFVGYLFCFSSTLMLCGIVITILSIQKNFNFTKKGLFLVLLAGPILFFSWIQIEERVNALWQMNNLDLSELMLITSVSSLFQFGSIDDFFKPWGLGNIISYFSQANLDPRFFSFSWLRRPNSFDTYPRA